MRPEITCALKSHAPLNSPIKNPSQTDNLPVCRGALSVYCSAINVSLFRMVKLDPVLFSLVHKKGEDNYDSMAWDEVFKRFIRQTIKSCNINTSTQKADYYILCEILLLELLIA